MNDAVKDSESQPDPVSSSSLPPEAIDFATRMFNAARRGEMDVLEQALAVGLPANLTNEKGDSLVSLSRFLSSLVSLM